MIDETPYIYTYDYFKGYQQGRADAIEELYNYLFQKLYADELRDNQIMYAINEYMKQIKEVSE